MRAPVLGGNFGVWGGLFSTFDCAVKGIRKKEDPYNAIIAGFFTGGSLAVRGGYKAARNGAIGCAVLLAVIEGVGIAFQRMLAGSTKLEVNLLAIFAFGSRNVKLICVTWTGTTSCSPCRRRRHGMNEQHMNRLLRIWYGGYAQLSLHDSSLLPHKLRSRRQDEEPLYSFQPRG